MKTKLIKSLAIATICAFGLNILCLSPTFADDPICNNDNISAEIKAANGCPGTSTPEFTNTVTNILNAIIAVAGIVAVIFIIIGGVQYMTSTGDPGKTKKAKDSILYALIGLIICALSFAIVNWAITSVINSQTTTSEESGEEP